MNVLLYLNIDTLTGIINYLLQNFINGFMFQVLCHANVAWQSYQRDHVPPTAIEIGSTVTGEKLYMGRALHDGTLTPGKVIINCCNTFGLQSNYNYKLV